MGEREGLNKRVWGGGVVTPSHSLLLVLGYALKSERGVGSQQPPLPVHPRKPFGVLKANWLGLGLAEADAAREDG